MNNYVKDNKNCHLLAFLSLLMARDVFEEVKLGIIVVGHTHEDIDGCFGYLSKKLKEEMDFESWVLGCLKDAPKMLLGHTDMHLFRFFIDSLGWLMMQYKACPQIMFRVR
jgi:hypothetical protein